MTQSLLPTRGIFVPNRMIFNTQLPSAVLVTWIQLRCLVWRGWVTPPFSLPQLASIIGIHPARLQRHLAQLQDESALVCQSARDGKLILSFPEDPTTNTGDQAATQDLRGTAVFNSITRGSPEPASYFPARILGYLSYEEDQDKFEISNDLDELNIGLEKVEKCY
jgi:hypothetical protein